MTRFPNAPEDSYVCEEGWLVIDDEAWTEEEWAARIAWAQAQKRSKSSPEGLARRRERMRRFRENNPGYDKQRRAAA